MINSFFYFIFIRFKKIFIIFFLSPLKKINIKKNKKNIFLFHWGLGDYIILSSFVENYINQNKEKNFMLLPQKTILNTLKARIYLIKYLSCHQFVEQKRKYNLIKVVSYFYRLKKIKILFNPNIVFSLRNDPRDLFVAKF